eukprot:scaffold15986_cov116-Cylindrotheca_fusiformis.AAC.3
MRNLDIESSTHTAKGYAEKVPPPPPPMTSSSEHSYDAKWIYLAGHIDSDDDDGEEWASPRISCSKRASTTRKSLSPIARSCVQEEQEEEDTSCNPTELNVRNCYNTFKEIGSPKPLDDPQDNNRGTPSRSDCLSSVRRGRRKRVSEHKVCILKSLKKLDL